MPATHDDVPIRLFTSDVLERFTHVHPLAVPLLWIPVASWALTRALVRDGLSAGETALVFAVGLVVWSFTEYAMHRFVFHFEIGGHHPAIDRLTFLFHGIHHVQPQIKTRLVMPPIVTVPLALLFYQGFRLVLGGSLGRPEWVAAMFGGFVAGYVCYDMVHYATHHLPMRSPLLRALKRHHMQHHYQTPDERYGVSSAVWDLVFGTNAARGRRAR
jgi:sterol desaturase/sphingolipid hydroxylase (fatty acid hydroxylase superfamily)